MTKEDLENERQRRLRAAQRVVIKIGTSIVTGSDGEIRTQHMTPLVNSMAELKKSGRQVVLVSSGAVGLGAGRLGLHPSRLRDLVVRQACAAVGQSLLMQAYEQLFSAHDVRIAQVLLTEDDFTDWKRYTNLRRTMERLLKLGVLPIVNENDTVSTAELEYVAASDTDRVFGDNDRLGALVMSRLESDALVLLTNVEGLLQRAPEDDSSSADVEVPQPIALVQEIGDELKAVANGPSAGGRGGMSSLGGVAVPPGPPRGPPSQ